VRLKKLKWFLLSILFGFGPVAFAQQNTLTQTTVAADIASLASSTTGLSTTYVISVTSATNIVGLTPNLGITASQPQQTSLYIDRELMSVIGVNGTQITVVRGQGGTVAAPHRKGAMVLVGYPYWFSVNDPGGSGGFSGTGGDSCVQANVVASPRVNTRTGAQWLCSSITLTYVPGFNNPLSTVSPQPTVAVASAAGAITPSGPLFHVTGTSAVTGFNIPVGCSANTLATLGGCSFTIIPDGVFTWTTAGNIALAGTAVVNKALTFTWDATNKKWIPSYIA
jgi:hypothetical protein